MIRLTVCLVLLTGCAVEDAQFLSGTSTKEDVGSQTGDAGRPDSWAPVSRTLGCGQPCADVGLGTPFCAEQAIAVSCDGGVVRCEQCSSTGRGCLAEDGQATCTRECEGNKVCPPGSDCFEMICCPNARWCQDGGQAICNDLGSEVVVQPCVEGLDCVPGGQCVPARAQVLVLFDTSGSMSWSPDETEAVTGPYPVCDDSTAPRSRLGLSKRLFTELFADTAPGTVFFALQRFPQFIAGFAEPACPAGPYDHADLITDHRGKWAISDEADGAWFENNLSEILPVPFTRAPEEDNRAQLARWLDFEEALVATDTACVFHSDCPNGMCAGASTGGGFCQELINPELRAAGWTPLGMSLFYASEIFRKHVVVDGRECALDADCQTPVHLCREGRCVDPNRFCRQRSVLVFTDGVDTASSGSWFSPVVQAKRLRAGLDCKSSEDCFEGFQCTAEDGCQPHNNPDNPCEPLGAACPRVSHTFPQAVIEKAERIRDANGAPIRVTVHVVDVSGSTASDSAGMAAYGGGQLISSSLDDTSALLE
ncbi:MAG: hypothetical protein ACI9WU_001698, partial [Myxococcota bacterium]